MRVLQCVDDLSLDVPAAGSLVTRIMVHVADEAGADFMHGGTFLPLPAPLLANSRDKTRSKVMMQVLAEFERSF